VGFSGLINGLAIAVKEGGPYVPPQYEAAYRQVAFEEQVPWALLAAWDGAKNGFDLPIPTQAEIYAQLVDEVLEKKKQWYEELCKEHPDDPAYCPPPEPTLDPEEKDQLWGLAYVKWYAALLGYIRSHSDYILDHQEQFDRDPEAAYRGVMSVTKAAKAAELYEGYQALAELDQHDDMVGEGAPPTVPPSWLPPDGFAWPAVGPITSRYGPRLSPIDGKPRFHQGIDIGLDSGDPIYASKAGTVISVEHDSTYGLMVVINHAGGYKSLYAHTSAVKVSPGQTVKQGQLIAYAGSTGLATGPHLHLEIHYLGTPVDPLLLLGR
jgi:hypothetical protein